MQLTDRELVYVPISDNCSHELALRLEVEGSLIAFYRQDTGEKLLSPHELSTALLQQTMRAEQEKQRAEQEKQRAEQEKQRAERAEEEIRKLHDRLLALGIDPNS